MGADKDWLIKQSFGAVQQLFYLKFKEITGRKLICPNVPVSF